MKGWRGGQMLALEEVQFGKMQTTGVQCMELVSNKQMSASPGVPIR